MKKVMQYAFDAVARNVGYALIATQADHGAVLAFTSLSGAGENLDLPLADTALERVAADLTVLAETGRAFTAQTEFGKLHGKLLGPQEGYVPLGNEPAPTMYLLSATTAELGSIPVELGKDDLSFLGFFLATAGKPELGGRTVATDSY